MRRYLWLLDFFNPRSLYVLSYDREALFRYFTHTWSARQQRHALGLRAMAVLLFLLPLTVLCAVSLAGLIIVLGLAPFAAFFISYFRTVLHALRQRRDPASSELYLTAISPLGFFNQYNNAFEMLLAEGLLYLILAACAGVLWHIVPLNLFAPFVLGILLVVVFMAKFSGRTGMILGLETVCASRTTAELLACIIFDVMLFTLPLLPLALLAISCLAIFSLGGYVIAIPLLAQMNEQKRHWLEWHFAPVILARQPCPSSVSSVKTIGLPGFGRDA